MGIRKSGLEAFSSTWRSLVRVFRCHQAAARPPARAEAAATRPNLSQPEEPSAAASLLPEASDFKRFAISLRKADRFLHPFLLVRFFPEIGCVEGTKEAIKNSLQKFRFLYLLFFESMLWCRYSGREAVELTASGLEASCVTGLPARTAKSSCRLFLSACVQMMACREPPRLLLRLKKRTSGARVRDDLRVSLLPFTPSWYGERLDEVRGSGLADHEAL